jgi:Ser/Thr protein kinase RdoA (MazF antagonist)
MYFRTWDGDCCGEIDDWVYTLAASLGHRPLRDIQDPAADAAVPLLLVRLHGSLRTAGPITPDHPCQPPAMWDSRRWEERLDVVACALRRGSSACPFDFLGIVDFLRRLQSPRLHQVSTPRGSLHGDFWPGNLIEPPINGAPPGVIDFDNSFDGPLLLDVAQYVDLAYSTFDGGVKSGFDLARASRFARMWAVQSGFGLEILSDLADVLVAGRACSMLWILERHVTEGPGPLDAVLENDRRTVEFTRQVKSEWLRALTATGRRSRSGPGDIRHEA